MLPWLSVFDGVDHMPPMSRLNFRNMRAYVKSRRTGQWTLLGGPAKATGFNYGKPGTGWAASESVVGRSDTSSTIRMGRIAAIGGTAGGSPV
jgi:hypothetical protein